jgi:DNA-directed RNA polymerase specialized sigma24 family protein
MKTSISNKKTVLASPSIHSAHPSDVSAELDDLVRAAATGDRGAIGAVAVAFGPTLLTIARRHAGREDAEDAVQDLFLSLVEGRAARFPPAEGRAMAWLGGLVRSLARARAGEARSTSVLARRPPRGGP